jgi:hypothetical protein
VGLIFKRPNTRQPQGVVQLDGSNPLNQRPAFVWVPNRGKELVQQSSWTLAGSTPPTLKATPSGVATLHTSGAATVSYVDLGTPTGSVDLGTGPATYVGVFYASAASGVCIAERNDANAVNIGWVLGYVSGNNAGTYGLGFVQEHGTTNTRKSISNAVVAGLNVLVVTYDGGLLATGINVYLNGVLGSVNGSQDGVGTTGTDAARNLYVGRCSYDTSRSHNGSILLAGAFKRIWSAAEVLSFSRNPWQIFQSPPRELQLDVPASGTTTATAAAGTATVSATAATTSATTGTAAAGVATVSITAASLAATTTTAAAGVSTVSGTAASGAASTGSAAAGSATVSGAAAASSATTGTAAGVASVSGSAASTAVTTATSADGTATVSGTASGGSGSNATAANGAATVSATAESVAATTATSADGVATVSASAQAILATDAIAAAGVATVSATAVGLTAGETTPVPSNGLASVSAIASSIAETVAEISSGTATVSASTGGAIDYEALAAAVWAYTLSNGKTAEQNLVENNDMLEALSALPNLDTPIEGMFSSADLLRVIAAVAAGKTSIESVSPGTATVEFRDVNDTETRVSAEMVGSERASVTINP